MAELPGPSEVKNAENDEEGTLAAARAGDPAALGRIYERYVRPVFRYLHSQIGDTADAEDVTSQTFLSALEAVPPPWAFRRLAFHDRASQGRRLLPKGSPSGLPRRPVAAGRWP